MRAMVAFAAEAIPATRWRISGSKTNPFG